jgi:hypothetical protein
VLAIAQDASGWQNITDKKNLCQVTALADWTPPKAYINVVPWKNSTFD